MQDRLTYANGNTITTEGFKCVVGEPIDIIAYEDTPFSHNAVIDVRKQMLVTLEVDGEIVCYRELHDFEIVNEDEPAIIVGDYTINIDSNELTGEYTSARIRLEPVELTVSDAFRAAVSKTAPQSGGDSGGGGGVLLVKANMDGEGNFTSLDKTWKEIHDAGWGVIYYEQGFLADYYGYQYEPIQFCACSESDSKYYVASQSAGLFVAASASDYPTPTGE